MTNLERYNKIFRTDLGLKDEDLNADLRYQGIPAWDSVAHMGMVADMEEAFGIRMETLDVFDFNNYEKGIVILREKYDVEI